MTSPDDQCGPLRPDPAPAVCADSVIHQHAEVTGQGSVIYQAARDQHIHYPDGTNRTRRTTPDGQERECPYPGLASFDADHARWFFGRDEGVAELIGLLDTRLRAGGVQIVVGQSGAGKSSLLRAGLLPALARGALPGSARWPSLVLTPGTDPVRVLAAQLHQLTGDDRNNLTTGQLDEFCTESLDALLCRHAAPAGPDALPVVVVDQFEELFTLCADDTRRRTFIDLLAHLADVPGDGPDPANDRARPRSLVVAGVRADFFAVCADYPRLRPALQERPLLVAAMTRAQLREAIVHPARDVGLDIEPGLIEVLMADLGATPGQDGAGYEAGRLPLLAHALRATWQQRHGASLTVDGYKTTGGIAHAISTTAERVFARLDDTSRRVARSLLLRLVRLGDGDGANDTRRRVPHAELVANSADPAVAAAVIDAFTSARLLTRHRDTVEITHEALLRGWPQLRGWIDTDRAARLVHQDLEEDAALWERAGRDPSMLYRGSRLEATRTFAAAQPPPDLSPAAGAFLTASTRLRLRAARLRTVVIAVLAALVLATGGAALVAVHQWGETVRQRDTAVYNRVLAEADRLAGTDVSLSAQLTLLAHRMEPGPDTSERLLATRSAALSTALTGHTSTVWTVAFSPDGRTLASAGGDLSVRLWDVSDPAKPRLFPTPLTGQSNTIASVAFSPGGDVLASASFSGSIRLWDVSDPARPKLLGRPLHGHTSNVYSVAFSPDGRVLASSGKDRVVRLWDVSDPARPRPLGGPLTGHGDIIAGVAFSPDGRTLASASDDGWIRLWDLAAPGRPRRLGSPLHVTSPSYSVAFSPDGRTLAAAALDKRIRLWDVSDPRRPRALGAPLTGNANTVLTVAFGPDGRTLAAAGGDRTIRLWDVSDPARPLPTGTPLTGHANAVRAVAFSPDGRTLASASDDHTVRLWSLPRDTLTGHTSTIWSASFNPDGRTLASAGSDRTIRLWDVSDPAAPRPSGAPLHAPDIVSSAAFSPRGHILAAAGANQPIRLWDTTDPAHPRSFVTPLKSPSVVYALAFSPDGRILAGIAEDRSIRLWDVSEPDRPRPLPAALTGGHTNDLRTLAFSPDGRVLASGGEGQVIRMWDVSDPSRPRLFPTPLAGHTETVYSLVFSPDGRTLASASGDQSIRLWDVSHPGRPKHLGTPLIGHADQVRAVAFSPDGRTLAGAGGDRTIRLWDVSDPARPRLFDTPLNGHGDIVLSLAFSPDGRFLASAGNDRTIRLWDRNADRTSRLICAATGNTLTRAEWRRRVGEDVPYAPPCD